MPSGQGTARDVYNLYWSLAPGDPANESAILMSAITRSVEDLVNASPGVNNRETFDALWGITCAMFDKVQSRFNLTKDPCCADLEPYKGKDGSGGRLSAYSGPEIDWLIHSWTGNPEASFTNMHLTISLGPQVDVPHFGFALGTIPNLFWYMDTMPRRELVTHPDYVEKYWSGAASEAYLDLQKAPGFAPFISRDAYTRVALSPNAWCFSGATTGENVDAISKASHAALDRKFADWSVPDA